MTLISGILQLFLFNGFGQYKEYKISVKGDTINATDKKGFKQGKWIVKVAEVRGEPGYEEEGIFKNDKKEGTWRKYNLNSDLLAIENYRFGGKDGLQQYYTPFGDITREENWRGYNPDAPYDTIPIYGTGSNEIVDYKIVKAEQYSVRHGDWKYYDASTGRIIKTETYDRGNLAKTPDSKDVAVGDKPKSKVKPKEVLEFEKKNSRKKKVLLRQGQTTY
ncbi:MAG: hypothetical protein ABJA57_04630 [Ginsengibacter sp.]